MKEGLHASFDGVLSLLFYNSLNKYRADGKLGMCRAST